MDFVERPLRDYGQHQAQVEDITLPQGTGMDFAATDPFDIGPSDGIGSQDFLDVDLGIDWDDVPQKENEDAMSVDESVGVGRDAASARSLIEFPQLNGLSKGIDLDMHSIRSLSRDPWWVVIVATSFVGGRYFKLSPPLAIVLGATMGLVRYGVVDA